MFRPIALCLAAGALVGSSGLTSAPARAADPPPARNANIWDGLPHEPSAPSVQRREQASGVALPTSEQDKLNREVEQLSHKLLDEQKSDGAAGSTTH